MSNKVPNLQLPKNVKLKPSPHAEVLNRQIDKGLDAMKRASERVRVINPPLPK